MRNGVWASRSRRTDLAAAGGPPPAAAAAPARAAPAHSSNSLRPAYICHLGFSRQRQLGIVLRKNTSSDALSISALRGCL